MVCCRQCSSPFFSNHANNLSSGTNCCVRGQRDVGGKGMWVAWGCRRDGDVRGMEMQVGWRWDGDGMGIQAAAAPWPRGTSVPASYTELDFAESWANFRCLHSALALAPALCNWCQSWAGESTAAPHPQAEPRPGFFQGFWRCSAAGTWSNGIPVQPPVCSQELLCWTLHGLCEPGLPQPPNLAD